MYTYLFSCIKAESISSDVGSEKATNDIDEADETLDLETSFIVDNCLDITGFELFSFFSCSI